MAIYALIEANEVVNLVQWDGVTPFTPPSNATLELLSSLPVGVSIGWTLSGSTWSAPAVVSITTNLGFEQFMTLFTAAEWTAIMTAAQTNTVIISWLLKAVSNSLAINLSSPLITVALNYLVAQSLLTSARETAILAGTVMNPTA